MLVPPSSGWDEQFSISSVLFVNFCFVPFPPSLLTALFKHPLTTDPFFLLLFSFLFFFLLSSLFYSFLCRYSSETLQQMLNRFFEGQAEAKKTSKFKFWIVSFHLSSYPLSSYPLSSYPLYYLVSPLLVSPLPISPLPPSCILFVLFTK